MEARRAAFSMPASAMEGISGQHKKGIWTGFWFTCLGFVVIWFGGIKLSLRDRILSKKYIHTSSELRH